MNNNQFYREQRRDNDFLDGILEFFSNNSSHAKLLLEVFVRKNFGKNYFNMGSAFSVAGQLAILPYLIYYIPILFDFVISNDRNWTYTDKFWKLYTSWYILLAAFLLFAFIRWFEVLRTWHDSPKTTTYNGDVNRFFTKLNFLGEATPKMISVVYEPLAFFTFGLAVKLVGQNVGWVIMISSVFYSLGYLGDFRFGSKVITQEWDNIKKNKQVRKIFEGADNDDNMVVPNGNPPKERLPQPSQDDDEPTFVL